MKRKILILTLGLLMATSVKAQIFMMDDETSDRTVTTPGLYVDVPNDHGLGVDYYAPVGGGFALLTAFGGAYLLGKRNNGRRDIKK